MSIAAIADTLDVHPNTVRFHLDTLFGTGRVEQVAPDRKGPGRPALMFRATRRMDPGGPRHYQLLAEILAMGLAGDRDAVRQGACCRSRVGSAAETAASDHGRGARRG